MTSETIFGSGHRRSACRRGADVEHICSAQGVQHNLRHPILDPTTPTVEGDLFAVDTSMGAVTPSDITGPASVEQVHLSVGDAATASEFYLNRGGCQTTAEPGSSALFVSAGGYHHHMAMNTRKSRGAGQRRLALGLGLVRIEVPAADDLYALGDRLHHYGPPQGDDGLALRFDDPWLNRIEVTSMAGD